MRDHTRTGIALLVLVPALACQWSPRVPRRERLPVPVLQETVLPLPIGAAKSHTLDCPQGDCQVRFRIEVMAYGDLLVVATPHAQSREISLRLTLEDPTMRVLDQIPMRSQGMLQVTSAVQPGPYSLLVQAIGGRMPFEVVAHFTPDRVQPAQSQQLPPPPPPRLRDESPPAVAGSDSAYDPSVDFNRYRNFAFAQNPQERLEAPPGAQVGNPFIDQQIQQAIRYELSLRNFYQTAIEEADFLVSLHVGARSQTWYSFRGVTRIDAYDYYFDQWRGLGGAIYAHTYRDGMLVIDLVDSETGKLVWHGWTTQSIGPARDSKEIIRSFVKDILDRFPPT